MSRQSALEFDAQLTAIPLYVLGTSTPNPDRDAFREQWAQTHGVERAPADAVAVGCRDCMFDDRLRHPELAGHVYCSGCPATRDLAAELLGGAE